MAPDLCHVGIEQLLLEQSAAIGREAYAWIERLYPHCRSLTGNGIRKTLAELQELVPLEIHEIATGTRAYDWTVPNEWNIREAYIEDELGRRVVDFRDHNLHVAGYSAPVDAWLRREELLAHVFTDPAHPEWIPYRHFYYRDNWAFCMSQRQFARLEGGAYRVVIDSTLQPGSLTYGELYLPGSEEQYVLVSTHICHPSLCNDNLSGVIVTALLARSLMNAPRRFGLRFLFAPATLGPLVWMSRNEDGLTRIRAGVVIANVGDRGGPTYSRSRRGEEKVDRAFAHVLAQLAPGRASVRAFAPVGYDQRQYCSPGFNLPVGCLQRTPNGEYAEYHSSGDDLQFVAPEALAESWRILRHALNVLDEDQTYLNLVPKGEPHLGPRGLFADAERLGLFWILNFSDGAHSLLDIAERSGIAFWRLVAGAQRLEASGLLKRIGDNAVR